MQRRERGWPIPPDAPNTATLLVRDEVEPKARVETRAAEAVKARVFAAVVNIIEVVLDNREATGETVRGGERLVNVFSE